MQLQNIVLIGFMGSGKSSIGRLLAKNLAFQFIDSDRLIVERAGMEITEIFAQHGENHFRELETEVIRSLLPRHSHVIATGGGVVLRESNRVLLRELGFVVALSASEEVIFERISRNSKRPLLQTSNPRETIRGMVADRHGLYEQTAQWTIDTSTLTHEEVAAAILSATENLWQSKL